MSVPTKLILLLKRIIETQVQLYRLLESLYDLCYFFRDLVYNRYIFVMITVLCSLHKVSDIKIIVNDKNSHQYFIYNDTVYIKNYVVVKDLFSIFSNSRQERL